MRYLILSDIHANLDGLETVLAHASGAWDKVLVLGDLVGYGAEPNEVMDRIHELKAAAVEEELNRADSSPVLRARLDAVEREKLELYQRRYAEYVRVAKALQALVGAPGGPNGVTLLDGDDAAP